MGVAPTRPGIPLRHSRPAQPHSTVTATSGSHGSPAPTDTRTSWPLSAVSMPRTPTRTTRPSTPASPTTRFEPPPSTLSATPRDRAHVEATRCQVEAAERRGARHGIRRRMILSQRVDAGHEGLARVDRGALGLDTVVIEVEQSRGVNLAAPVFFDPVLGHRRERAPDSILPVDRLPENEQLVAPAVQRLPLRAGRADQETEALLADVTKHERAHAGWAVTVGGGEDAGVDERITGGAGALAVGDDLGDRIDSHAWQAYTIRGVTDSIARLDALATRCLT